MAQVTKLNFFVCVFACTSVAGLVKANSSLKDASQITKVHMVFMNHLDVGYDGIHPTVGFALNVINRYFVEYYPRAVGVAAGLREFGFRERFVYTTHPWLLYLYLHCKPVTLASNVTLKCPNSSALSDMRASIGRGDVVWHAGPMNMQYEVMHPLFFDLSLNFGFMLDKEFNISRSTPVVSQRDVPGMTKAVIPGLRNRKIAAISVGVNSMTSPPAVPRTPFLWKTSAQDPDDQGIIAFWHPGGYPNNPGTFPSQPGGLSVDDCLFAQDVSAFPEVLCFAFRTDNSGPPMDINEVLENFEVARGQFPKATVVGSTLDQYVAGLKASATGYPVVTQEIGDTWIMGIQSDPKKLALYRLFTDILADCFQRGECNLEDGRVLQAVHYVTKVPEHTWGLNSVKDFQNWTNADFQKARTGQPYRDCEASWQEQRQFLQLAFQALGNHPVTKTMVERAKQLVPVQPDLSEYEEISSDVQTCSNGMMLQFSDTGALSKVYDPFNKVDWASSEFPLGQILYNTYNESDYDLMSQLYDYHGTGGAGFHKLNSTQYAHPESRWWLTKMQAAYRRKGSDTCDFVVKIVPADQMSVTQYGAPPLFYVQFKAANTTGESARGGLDVVVQWFNKGPTRLAESLSFGFAPVPHDGGRWSMDKLDSVIDPTDVILNGSQYLHAIRNGVYYEDGEDHALQILSPDVPLLLLGTAARPPSVFPVPLTPIQSQIRSAAFNLYNNLWSTNYIYWYPYLHEDKDFKARFRINFA